MQLLERKVSSSSPLDSQRKILLHALFENDINTCTNLTLAVFMLIIITIGHFEFNRLFFSYIKYKKIHKFSHICFCKMNSGRENFGVTGTVLVEFDKCNKFRAKKFHVYIG